MIAEYLVGSALPSTSAKDATTPLKAVPALGAM
jgi:hypothetical protein